mgnify:CR=1 FL=1
MLSIGVMKKQKTTMKTINGKKTKPAPIVESMNVTPEVQKDLSVLYEKATVSVKMELHEFTPDYIRERGELYYINNVELPEDILTCLSNPKALADYNPSKDQDINCIFIGSSDMSRIAFKKIESKQYISNSKINLFYDDSTFKRNKGSGLILDDSIDFFYIEGTLYFRSFDKVNSVIDITQYFEIATDEGVNSFISDDRLRMDDEESFRSVLDRSMKRQILLIEKRGILNRSTEEIEKMAKDKGLKLDVKDGKIVMPNDKKEIKTIMRFLAGKIFLDDIYQEPMYANSVARVNK